MTVDELLKTMEERPFRPFRIYLTDGASYDVPHPDLVIVGLEATVVGVPSPARPKAAAFTVKLANEHITRVVPQAVVEPAR